MEIDSILRYFHIGNYSFFIGIVYWYIVFIENYIESEDT